MPTLPAPFSIITPQATLEALDKAKADLPLDFLRTFTINPLLMYPCSHAVLVPITACSMQRYNSASMLDPGITRLAEYFAMNDGAKWRGNLPWNWAVGIVRTGKDKLPREYNSEEPLITIETADGLVVDVLMGGHLITATGSAGSILSMAGKHAAAQAFQFFPMYLFPNELSTVITGQFLTEVALLDNLKHDLARINNPDSTMTLVMTAIVEKACRLSDSPISSNWDSAMSYPSLWETLNRALECSPDAELPFGSEKRELRCAMVDLIRNLDVWLPLAKLLTNLVPCTAKPGFNELGTVLRQTSTLEWVKILLGVFNMRYQPVTMWSAMDAVQVHIACGNPFVTNADVYSKIGPADNNTYCSLFDATAGLRNESHGLLVDGKTMWDGFRKVQLDNNPRFGTFVSLADMGRFRRWDHGFVSAIGCFALAHWIIFGTTIYNMISGTRRTYRNLKTHRKNADSDNFYEYIKAHTPPAFFMRLNRMAETAARQSNIAHFPKNFWTELLTPSFEVPSAYTPPKVKMPDVMPSLVWGATAFRNLLLSFLVLVLVLLTPFTLPLLPALIRMALVVYFVYCITRLC
ncbi:hypothetical protein BDZ89DRAFT_245543 [Hymenopellis radicata]|nr:hypothetical protein BDZ89DRAFT_245543 [Hymenopellis radicata]